MTEVKDQGQVWLDRIEKYRVNKNRANGDLDHLTMISVTWDRDQAVAIFDRSYTSPDGRRSSDYSCVFHFKGEGEPRRVYYEKYAASHLGQNQLDNSSKRAVKVTDLDLGGEVPQAVIAMEDDTDMTVTLD